MVLVAREKSGEAPRQRVVGASSLRSMVLAQIVRAAPCRLARDRHSLAINLSSRRSLDGAMRQRRRTRRDPAVAHAGETARQPLAAIVPGRLAITLSGFAHGDAEHEGQPVEILTHSRP